jgi:Aminoglycoside-2''-adenylyltransferase
MIRQTTREEPAPWEEALRLFHPRVKDLGVNWWLGGSAALALRGAHVSPRDIDVITDATGALAIDGALHDALIEPLTASDGWIAGCFGRAFLEMRIEWVGDVVAEIDSPHVTDFGPTAARSREIVEWEDMEFRLPPLYLQLYSATRRKLDDRVAVIAELVRS